jgi:hypothetical protein
MASNATVNSRHMWVTEQTGKRIMSFFVTAKSATQIQSTNYGNMSKTLQGIAVSHTHITKNLALTFKVPSDEAVISA